MPLSVEDRGVLERQVDNFLSLIPQYVEMFRDKQSQLHIKEPNDAVLGFVLGSINTSFAPTLTHLAFTNRLTPDIMTEVSEIVFRRITEIRDRIFDTGWIKNKLKMLVLPMTYFTRKYPYLLETIVGDWQSLFNSF